MIMASWWKQPGGTESSSSTSAGAATATSTTPTNLNLPRRTPSSAIDIEEAAGVVSTTTPAASEGPGNAKRRGSFKGTDYAAVPLVGAEKPPLSRGIPPGHLPITMNVNTNKQGQGVVSSSHAPEPKLIHPILSKISITTRFAFNGLLSNVLFMLAYNWSIENIPEIAPPTMYSIVYLIFIPIGHAMVSLLVFGWPEKYCPSLMSNFPIGLTAIGIGGGLTAWLDSVDFNQQVANYVRNNFQSLSTSFSTNTGGTTAQEANDGDDEEATGEFYSSIVVLVITSLWTYILSIYVNSPPEKSEKKEL